MIGLFKSILALTGIILIFYFLVKAIIQKSQQQLKKAFVALLMTCGVLILITAVEFLVKAIT